MSTAVISDCGTYRYRLGRWIGEGRLGSVLFVMLNPSRATAEINDPTITRCIGFASSWGYSELEVVNLFAYRATDPRDLKAAHGRGVDVVGPDNDRYVRGSVNVADLVVCAWGAQPMAKHQYKAMCRLITEQGKPLHCISVTKSGQPNHPLMLRANLTPKAWVA